MNDLEYLKEGISDHVFRTEPFAQALLFYLEQNGLVDHSKFLNVFDSVVSRNIEQLIAEQRENDESTKGTF